MLHYCFNCAIPLVKQGFPVEELTAEDKLSLLKPKESVVAGDSVSQVRGERGLNSPQPNNPRLKIGEQIKCRIIAKVNRLKTNR